MSASPENPVLNKVIALAKSRGFVYPCGDIYGGTRSAWDYGPLGVELKENIKRQWWKSMVQARSNVVGLDSSIILPRRTWEVSGHVDTFTDPQVECSSCHRKFRLDHLQEEYASSNGIADPDTVTLAQLPCSSCGLRNSWLPPILFSGLLKTHLGSGEDEENLHYLRPETAQGIFLNFSNVISSSNQKPPFGIAQIGKSFRNEITPGNFIFRTREFEQMEMEFFVPPDEDETWHQYWIEARTKWFTDLGIDPANLRHFDHPKHKLSHYSKRTVDIEYRFKLAGSEWGELEGIANRTDYDLKTHSKGSGADLRYTDQVTGDKYFPYVIEPAVGVARSMMAFLLEAYTEDEAPNTKGGVDKRVVLKLDPRLAPVKIAVLPLVKNNSEIVAIAQKLTEEFSINWTTEYSAVGAVGKRYRRFDEIGTPFCVTVDFDSLEWGTATVRERDSMEQETICLTKLSDYLAIKLRGC